MDTDLNEVFEAGCESAYDAAYNEMVETWGEKTANVVMDKLKSAGKAVGDFYSPTAVRKKNYKALIGDPKNAEKYEKIHAKGRTSATSSGAAEVDKHLSRRTALEVGGKAAGTAAVAGGVGYGGYKAMGGGDKKRR